MPDATHTIGRGGATRPADVASTCGHHTPAGYRSFGAIASGLRRPRLAFFGTARVLPMSRAPRTPSARPNPDTVNRALAGCGLWCLRDELADNQFRETLGSGSRCDAALQEVSCRLSMTAIYDCYVNDSDDSLDVNLLPVRIPDPAEQRNRWAPSLQCLLEEKSGDEPQPVTAT